MLVSYMTDTAHGVVDGDAPGLDTVWNILLAVGLGWDRVTQKEVKPGILPVERLVDPQRSEQLRIADGHQITH